MGNQPTKEYSNTNGNLNLNLNLNLNSGFLSNLDPNESKVRPDKLQRTMESILDQIVMANETCFGGRLAPWGDYKYNLDCDWSIVKTFIWKRRLAPFYTPLEDKPEEDLQMIETILKERGLHQHVSDKKSLWETTEEDVDEHRIHMSSNARKRRDMKLIKMKAKEKAWNLQREQESIYQKQKVNQKVSELYLNGDECPICFLYYPSKLNITSCCHQRICTECFVQMRRLPPHISEGEGDVLVSEPVKCAFCATTPFTICFDSIPVGPDDIRPKWEAQMVASQKRRLRRSAAATLLHADSIGSSVEDRLVAETLKLSLLEK